MTFALRMVSGLAVVGLACVAACGGGGGTSEDELDAIGFAIPGEPTTAYKQIEGVWTLQGPANWSCLGTATSDVPTSVPITVSGALLDFQTDGKLPGAEITLFNDTNLTGSGVATAVADETGEYELIAPVGGMRWAVKVSERDALDTYTMNQYLEPAEAAQTFEFNSVSLLTAQALNAFIGVTRTPGLGIVAGTIRDCDGNVVRGAVAAMSDVADVASHLDGAASYYFSALSTSLPVRHSQQKFTNNDGVFVTIELPVSSSAFAQVWGFVDDADMADGEMTLIAQVPAPILADAVVIARMEALRQ